ncbi:MAG: transporter, family [Gemmatimonadaceae bacterium]|jgi:UMF1 family MFS transporter|nr:transporter, family [Gemmatimonadaceae bacterium]
MQSAVIVANNSAVATPGNAADGDLNPPLAPLRERLSWALYDFANTVFSMNIATLYFSAWLVKDLGHSNTLYATVNGIASALVVVSIPLFGAISDATQKRKPWVVGFTLVACVSTILIAILGQIGLPLIGEGVTTVAQSSTLMSPGLALFAVLAAFTLANYAYQGAQPFYNAMLPELAPVDHRGRLSGLGSAFGYAGSITGVLLTFPFFSGSLPILGAIPERAIHFLRNAVPFTAHGGRVSTFVPTAILFLVFSLPLFLFCRDHNAVHGKKRIQWREAFGDVRHTLKEAKRYPGTLRFILTSFLYQDAMGTIITNMALYAIYAMGFKGGSEATLFVILTIPAVFGSYGIGRLVDRFGPKRTLSWVLTGWVVLLIAMIVVPTRGAFWIVGACIGLIYGGVATAERPLLLSLVPDVEAGRFFSLMVLSSRAAAVVGPFVWAFAVDGLTPSMGTGFAYRAGVATVAIGMILALLMLRGVPDNFLKPARSR